MKTLFLIATVAAFSFDTCTAQAQERKTRQLGSFDAVSSSGGIDVVLTQGATTSVTVEASAEAQSHLVTEVKDGALTIGWERDYSWRNLLSSKGKVVVYITSPRLKSVSMSGGADARSESTFTTDNFRINASGGSDINLTLAAKTISVQASGGSDIKLAGRAERLKVNVSGGSDYDGFALRSTAATVSASGGSDANVSAESEISVNASGGSDIRYKGAAKVSKSSSGGSSVRHIQ
ncbi:head GIN domain-containing protein [Hymenobacter sp. IS2118]|uniref:head GIN domain-containing protein n=1 Tax=Hymenobacter sp. IS2118 TaxID=1505605 RepID=UPI000558E2BD|nr:head GIN domain-containing protein [Hymenobacter sp. IS2118]